MLLGDGGLVIVLGAFTRMLPSDERGAWGRGFGVLLAYSVLFVGSLAKIWWTAGKPAVEIAADGFAFQPLHTFGRGRSPSPACSPSTRQPGTEALRFVVEARGEARELFLNLAVVKGQHRFVELLGDGLARAGLTAVPGRERSWQPRRVGQGGRGDGGGRVEQAETPGPLAAGVSHPRLGLAKPVTM